VKKTRETKKREHRAVINTHKKKLKKQFFTKKETRRKKKGCEKERKIKIGLFKKRRVSFNI